MNATEISTALFLNDGRGPRLHRWIYDSQLHFEGAFFPNAADSIAGAEYELLQVPAEEKTTGPWHTVELRDTEGAERGWVVFHGLQVFQVAPEEVHSYWHLECRTGEKCRSGVYQIEDSEWMKSFSPRHLGRHSHFLLEFYDELVEVICQELIFGSGTFDINHVVDRDPRFAYAYFRRADQRRKDGNLAGSREDFLRYAELSTDESSVRYARKCAESMS